MATRFPVPAAAGRSDAHWHGDGCDPPHAEPVQAVPCGSPRPCDRWAVAVVTAVRGGGPSPAQVAQYRCAEHVRQAADAYKALYREVRIRPLP